MKHKPKKTVSILLPMDLYNQISDLAKDTCRTIPGYIRHILITHLDNLNKTKI